MELTVIDKREDLTHVALAGRLDVVGVEAVGRQFDEEVGARGVNTVVDMSEVEFLASMGLGLLLRNATILGRKGARLVLFNPPHLVEEVMRIAGLDQITPVASDLDEALSKLVQSAD